MATIHFSTRDESESLLAPTFNNNSASRSVCEVQRFLIVICTLHTRTPRHELWPRECLVSLPAARGSRSATRTHLACNSAELIENVERAAHRAPSRRDLLPPASRARSFVLANVCSSFPPLFFFVRASLPAGNPRAALTQLSRRAHSLRSSVGARGSRRRAFV